MSSGDVGHFDEQGRLFIDGRDDEMIVSGGENVFPAEVEELLAGHEAIEEAAAIGVDDEKFGQRLKAFVVLRDGRSSPRTRSRATSRTTSPATRSRARSCSSTSCRATRPARCSSASSPSDDSDEARAQGGRSRGGRTSSRPADFRPAVRRLPGRDLPARDGRRAPGSPGRAGGARPRSRGAAETEAADYVFGGAGSEDTMRANEEAFRRWRIVPRMLRDVGVRDLRTGVRHRDAGAAALAPIGVQSIVHADGELATARAAAAIGLPMAVPPPRRPSIEEAAEANGDGPQLVPALLAVATPSSRRASSSAPSARATGADRRDARHLAPRLASRATSRAATCRS